MGLSRLDPKPERRGGAERDGRGGGNVRGCQFQRSIDSIITAFDKAAVLLLLNMNISGMSKSKRSSIHGREVEGLGRGGTVNKTQKVRTLLNKTWVLGEGESPHGYICLEDT